MIRSLVLAVASMAVFTVPPAFAEQQHHEQMVCSSVGMQEAMADVQSMQEGEKKTQAMSHMKMAEDALAKHDMEGCMNHMQAARDAMKQ